MKKISLLHSINNLNMSKQIIIKIIFFFTIIQLKAQKYDIGCYVKDPNARYREHNVDFTKLNLDLNFIPKDGLVIGLATYGFKILNPLIDTVFLDAINMNIEKVSIQNIGDIPYKVSKTGLTLDIKKILPPQKNFNPAQEYTLLIQYKAYPKKGLYFIGWNDSFNLSQKQIWSQGQGIDNR